MKLPYKLREKWRNVACDILEQIGSRAVFVDLVNFIEKQVKIVSDPLFGNIHDISSVSQTKPSTQVKQKRKSGTFATSINTIQDGDQDNNRIIITTLNVCFATTPTTHWTNAHSLK